VENITADVVLDPTNLRELRSMADEGMPEIWSDLLERFVPTACRCWM
jgi:hypothetical protein